MFFAFIFFSNDKSLKKIIMESESHLSKSIGDPNSQHPSIDGIPFSATTLTTIPTISEIPMDDASTYDPKRLKSMVWQHFKKKMINGEWKAICNYCKRKLGGKSKSGTSHFMSKSNSQRSHSTTSSGKSK